MPKNWRLDKLGWQWGESGHPYQQGQNWTNDVLHVQFHLILMEFSVFCLFMITLFIQINLIAAWSTTLSPLFNVPLINLSKLT